MYVKSWWNFQPHTISPCRHSHSFFSRPSHWNEVKLLAPSRVCLQHFAEQTTCAGHRIVWATCQELGTYFTCKHDRSPAYSFPKVVNTRLDNLLLITSRCSLRDTWAIHYLGIVNQWNTQTSCQLFIFSTFCVQRKVEVSSKGDILLVFLAHLGTTHISVLQTEMSRFLAFLGQSLTWVRHTVLSCSSKWARIHLQYVWRTESYFDIMH